MRFAFWRRSGDTAPIRTSASDHPPMGKEPTRIEPALLPSNASTTATLAAPPAAADIDVRAIFGAIARKKHIVIAPTLLALVISLAIVNMITPRYKSEARILIDGRENIFLRPTGERDEQRSALDPEAVTSQVQLLLQLPPKLLPFELF